jgi:hypothetical protein
MSFSRKKYFIPFIFIFVMAFSVQCMASVPPQNTPEIQRIDTATVINSVGLATETDAITWRLSSEVLDSNLGYFVNEPVSPGVQGMGDWTWVEDDSGGYWENTPGSGDFDSYPLADLPPDFTGWLNQPEPPLNPAGEVQMVNNYMENTVAMSGKTVYIKSTGVVTSPQASSKFNVKADKTVSFMALDGGKLVSDEEMMLDNVGRSLSLTSQTMGCPFSKDALGNCVPAFCNIVLAGSKVDISHGSFITGTESRSVAKDSGMDRWPPLPQVDGPPVEMKYGINLAGLGSSDAAEGSAMAFFKAHKLEGPKECPSGIHGAAQEITYNEVSSASGSIMKFQKIINYQSGISLSGCATCG